MKYYEVKKFDDGWGTTYPYFVDAIGRKTPIKKDTRVDVRWPDGSIDEDVRVYVEREVQQSAEYFYAQTNDWGETSMVRKDVEGFDKYRAYVKTEVRGKVVPVNLVGLCIRLSQPSPVNYASQLHRTGMPIKIKPAQKIVRRRKKND